jgi:hypothetical protein
MDLVRFAAIHLRDGSPEVAARLISRGIAVFEEIGLTLESWMAQEVDDAKAAVHALLDDTILAAAWEEGRNMSIEDAIALALSDAA